ncbi:rhomboid family intramembrane serine protease [Roseobacter litoralis]|uniref:rhomboid family intramembrane serine protease n=1 Tax=Roseobacter litoralis TaxID=42443 RepID=UPI0024910BF5|nr:rhomboid family intramembrane serine protease [Roseobacter litoralis]
MKVTVPLSPFDLRPVLRAFCIAIVSVGGLIAADAFQLTVRLEAIEALGFTLNWRNEPWRVLSYVFVHGDAWHMIFNIIPILLFGDVLALMRGIAETAFIVLISALAGVAGFAVFGIYPAMSGASAISFGLAAACLVHWASLTLAHRIVAIALEVTVAPSIIWWTGIAWEAHFVAATCGAGASVLMRKLRPSHY